MANVACDRRTWSVLAGLVGNELIEIAVVEVPARALAAVTNHDIFQVPIGDVTVEGLDRTIELCGSLGCSQQATRHAGFALVATGFRTDDYRYRLGEESFDFEGQSV